MEQNKQTVSMLIIDKKADEAEGIRASADGH